MPQFNCTPVASEEGYPTPGEAHKACIDDGKKFFAVEKCTDSEGEVDWKYLYHDESSEKTESSDTGESSENETTSVTETGGDDPSNEQDPLDDAETESSNEMDDDEMPVD